MRKIAAVSAFDSRRAWLSLWLPLGVVLAAAGYFLVRDGRVAPPPAPSIAQAPSDDTVTLPKVDPERGVDEQGVDSVRRDNARRSEAMQAVRTAVESSIEDLLVQRGYPKDQASGLVESLSPSALLEASEDSILGSSLFEWLVPAEQRESSRYRAKFRSVLSELRAQRAELIVQRDDLTGTFVVAAFADGSVQPLPKRPPGALLGGYVGSTRGGGWISIPRDHQAYAVQASLDAWPALALDILARLHL